MVPVAHDAIQPTSSVVSNETDVDPSAHDAI